MRRLSLLLGVTAVLAVAFVVLGTLPRTAAVSDDSPAYRAALSQAIRALDGVAQTTMNPTRVGVVEAQGQFTVQPGGPTCDGTITCQAWPTFVPVTCSSNDPECNFPAPITQDPRKCDPMAPTWDGRVTCHVGEPGCTRPTMMMYRTCDARATCDGSPNTCDGSFTHWNSTCHQMGQTCDGSNTCSSAAGGPFTCTHFTVDGTPTCNGVPTCRSTCDQWFTCQGNDPACPTGNQKTTWGALKGKYRN